jgi:hypothetical protein
MQYVPTLGHSNKTSTADAEKSPHTGPDNLINSQKENRCDHHHGEHDTSGLQGFLARRPGRFSRHGPDIPEKLYRF